MIKAIPLLENISAHRDEWLTLRAKKISGTKIATLAGLNPWTSVLEEWAYDTGKAERPAVTSRAARFGLSAERFLRELLSEELSAEVKEVDALYRHPEIEWAVASPDALITRPDGSVELGELKTGNRNQVNEWQDGGCPQRYYVQVLWYLYVMGLEKGWLGALIAGDAEDFQIRPVEADQAVVNSLIDIAAKYLWLVERDIPPDAGPGDSKIIESVVRRVKGQQAILAPEVQEQVADHLQSLEFVKAQMKTYSEPLAALEKQKKELENRVKLALGSGDYALIGENEVRVSTTVVPEKVVSSYNYTRLTIKNIGARKNG